MSEFQWTDKLVEDFYRQLSNQRFYHFSVQTYIDEFKKSKTVKAKDYEILEVVDQTRGVIKVGKGTSFSYVSGEPIHSVKRLSDGEIFTIGDKIECTAWSKSYSPAEIKYFQIANDGHLRVESSNGCNNPFHSISKVKQPIPLFTTIMVGDVIECQETANWDTKGQRRKIVNINVDKNIAQYDDGMIISIDGLHRGLENGKFKKLIPLFRTEDGKDIFEGDEYWFVTDEFIALQQESANDFFSKSVRGRFSTLAAAQEYIIMNKPTWSIQNLIHLLNLDTSYKPHPYISLERLVELLKSKS